MMGVHRWTPRDSNCRIDSPKSATPSLVWNTKKSRASTETLAADPHQGTRTHGGTVAPSQGCLCPGASSRSHFSQSRATDECPGSGNLSGLDRAHAGTKSEPGRTQHSHRAFCGENNKLCSWVVSLL